MFDTSLTPVSQEFDGSLTPVSRESNGVNPPSNSGELPLTLTLQELATTTGLKERFIRENRQPLEQALQRRISFNDRRQNNKVMFKPEAVDLFKAWDQRTSDDDFIEQYSTAAEPMQTEVEEVEAELLEPQELQSALTTYRPASIDHAFAETLQSLIPAAVQDVEVVTHEQEAVALAQFLALRDAQLKQNRTQTHKQRLEVAEAEAYKEELEVIATEHKARQNARDFTAQNKEIQSQLLELERQKQELKQREMELKQREEAAKSPQSKSTAKRKAK